VGVGARESCVSERLCIFFFRSMVMCIYVMWFIGWVSPEFKLFGGYLFHFIPPVSRRSASDTLSHLTRKHGIKNTADSPSRAAWRTSGWPWERRSSTAVSSPPLA